MIIGHVDKTCPILICSPSRRWNRIAGGMGNIRISNWSTNTMIDVSKTVSEYTDDEIKSLRSIFKEHCSGSPREFTIYKVFIQGVKEMRVKSPNSHIRDVPGYVSANAGNFPIQGDVTAFCERMATAISDMAAANGGADIEQITDGGCTALDSQDTDPRGNTTGIKTGYGDDHRPGRAQRRRDAMMRERSHNRDLES